MPTPVIENLKTTPQNPVLPPFFRTVTTLGATAPPDSHRRCAAGEGTSPFAATAAQDYSRTALYHRALPLLSALVMRPAEPGRTPSALFRCSTTAAPATILGATAPRLPFAAYRRLRTRAPLSTTALLHRCSATALPHCTALPVPPAVTIPACSQPCAAGRLVLPAQELRQPHAVPPSSRPAHTRRRTRCANLRRIRRKLSHRLLCRRARAGQLPGSTLSRANHTPANNALPPMLMGDLAPRPPRYA